jgi:prepilin-type N-terminal cleavage/methylation domain-containing protein
MWKRKNGFRLIELLIAMLIIGILMSLLIPAVGKIMENARRMRGANCLKQIAAAYAQYCNDDVNGRKIDLGAATARTAQNWAVELARGGYLNDPSAYCFSGDDGALKILRKSISGTDAWPKDDTSKDFSVWLIDNVPMDAPLTTTPIAFTRGLPEIPTSPSGTVAKWPSEGVYGDKGGYIAFLDGSTNDILDTIPKTAYIVKANGAAAVPGTGGGTT